MILRTKSGKFKVVSESRDKKGRRRSFGEYATEAEARKRLAQIEMFKKMKQE